MHLSSIAMPHIKPSHFFLIAVVAMLVAGCGGRRAERASRPPMAARDSSALLDGIDVSSHQGLIDWDKVTANKDIRIAYIKATEGVTYTSPHYMANLTAARRRGLLVGSYHYLTTTSPVTEQAAHFISVAPKHTQDLIPMIDVEDRGDWSRSQLIDSLTRMAGILEEHYGHKPMIYSALEFYNLNLSPRFNHYPLYIGCYTGSAPAISWEGHYTLWQFTENGIIPGIDTYVDQCRFHPDRWLPDILL